MRQAAGKWLWHHPPLEKFLIPYKNFVCMPNKKILFVLLFLFYASLVKTDVSWNDGSRFASVESMVERGTLAIDNSSFFNSTSDKIFYNGHFYSDKAPGMA